MTNEAEHYRRAMRCAIVPAIVGVAILVLYRLTYNEFLIIAGIAALIVGLIAYFFGMRSVYALRVSPTPQLMRWPNVLLNLNLLLAVFCVFAGGSMALNPPILWTVTNQGAEPAENVWIEHGQDRISFGTLTGGQGATLRRKIGSGNVRVIWWSKGIQKVSDLGHRDMDSVRHNEALSIVIDHQQARERSDR